MAVLALTARLAGVLRILIGRAADGFAVGHLRCAHVGLHLELAQQAVHNNLEVQLAHARNDGLAGLVVRIGAERRVLLSQLGKGNAHLLLAGLGFGLDGHADNRLGELHALQNDGVLFVAQRVAGGGVLQAHRGGNVAGVAHVDILTVVGVHLQNAAHALTVALYRVVHRGAGLHRAGIHAEEAQLAHKRVGGNFERQRREGRVVRRRAALLLFRVGVHALDVLNVRRGGHVVHNGVQQLLHALVLVGRAAGDGHDGVGNGLLADGRLHLGHGKLFAVEVLHHQFLVVLGNGLDELVMVFLGQLFHVLGNLFHADVLAQVIVIDVGLHLQQVDDAFESFLFANGQLNGHRIGFEAVAGHVQHMVEICAHDVHLVDVDHAGNMIFVGLVPNSLRLRLNATLGAQHGYRAVQHAQAALHLYGEVHVARGVDDVDPVPELFGLGRVVLILGMAPIARGGGRSDGDATLLLLCHPVHGGGAVVRLAELVVDACVEQDALGGGCFAGVDMGHDADVSGHFQRNVSRHSFLLKSSPQINICNARKPCWPRPSCGYPRAFCTHRRCRCTRP